MRPVVLSGPLFKIVLGLMCLGRLSGWGESQNEAKSRRFGMDRPSRAFYEGVNPKTIWNNSIPARGESAKGSSQKAAAIGAGKQDGSKQGGSKQDGGESGGRLATHRHSVLICKLLKHYPKIYYFCVKRMEL